MGTTLLMAPAVPHPQKPQVWQGGHKVGFLGGMALKTGGRAPAYLEIIRTDCGQKATPARLKFCIAIRAITGNSTKGVVNEESSVGWCRARSARITWNRPSRRSSSAEGSDCDGTGTGMDLDRLLCRRTCRFGVGQQDLGGSGRR